jgi:hypothetical protein
VKKGDTIQGRTLYKGGHYLRKYGSYNIKVCSSNCGDNVYVTYVMVGASTGLVNSVSF